ncbi:glycerol-3-phosphate acyltransferase [Deinococcus metallilatus]|uniref:Glycerol-3-phosphate acyltransferase n=1 Tax=Deinococcus metallilatus TaxID=1211322 RepID=A0AAJ5F4Q3_9DEIO|nr:glycerol-3-phosphate acyltransferase [Deinococcus metallilatus]RXJ12907.1 glycerol-3-phosphate acyltransferase [Deinococcus metallilatus]TLK27170.1 glycerol-3-phosphate acyltransferase [Deinococcus metallilatus]GMA16146.1 glycerol-3-phosphate acyltransferase 1 [Deinococcus metallilatus]
MRRIGPVSLLALPAVLVAYLIGSIPAAAWVARLRGVDIRKVGSGNSGATNVLRSLGTGPALAVAVFDILKGAIAVWLAHALGLDPAWAALCGVAAVIGHNFSPFLGFRGGKGVATSFGTMLALDPLVGGGAFVVGAACIWLTRLVSAGSILGALTAVVLALALPRPGWLILTVAFLAALLIWQHRDNIRRLQAGNERRLGEKK